MAGYLASPDRYELRPGNAESAPVCPYGNAYRWIGFDRESGEYIRFTKSVFKKLIQDITHS